MSDFGFSLRWLSIATAALFLCITDASVVRAQDGASLKIGVIDVQRVYRASTAAQTLQRDINKEREAYQKELQGKETGLRASEKKLLKQRSILSAEAFQNKKKELESEVLNLQRELQKTRAELDQRLNGGLMQVRQVLVKISREIMEQRQILVVVEKSAVVLVKPELEFTEEALAELNERLPKLPATSAQN